MAKNTFGKIKNLVTNTKLSLSARRRFVKCYVWSVLMYGCETWTMSQADEKRLQATEMWLWRRVLKVSWTERVTNEDILLRVGAKRELVSSVRKRQMRFLGHVMRQQELENLSLTGKIEGKRPRGRPRQKYMDGIVRATGGRMTATQLLHLAYKKDEWRAMVANVPDDTALR